MKKTLGFFSILGLLNGCNASLYVPSPTALCAVAPAKADQPFNSGTGTSADPYIICTPEQLNTLGGNIAYYGAHFSLGSDLDLSGYDQSTAATTFNRIGSFDNVSTGMPFTGFFEGNQHTISNLKLSNLDGSAVGLFGYTQGATIQNLSLEAFSISGVESVAALVGYAIGTRLYSIQIQGTVTGSDSVGGLVGAMYGNTVAEVSSLQNVSANITSVGSSNVGGLVGFIELGGGSALTISGASTSGNVSGADPSQGDTMGGLLGYTEADDSGTTIDISQSYSTANVTAGGSYIGGFLATVNQNGGSTVTIGYSNYRGSIISNDSAQYCGTSIGGFVGNTNGGDSTLSITHSYSSGTILSHCSATTQIGGFVGISNLISSGTVSISSSYSTSTVSLTQDSASFVGGFAGLAVKSGTVNGSFTDVYAAGTLNIQNNNSYIGGLCGGLTFQFATKNAYAAVPINLGAGNSDVGGFIGAHGGNISNSYFNSDYLASGVGHTAGGTGVPTGATTAQLKQQTTFSGWNFSTIWNIVVGVSPPTLR